jgi:UDP-2,3-diacylglucosamine pyrophosphatase LpxH
MNRRSVELVVISDVHLGTFGCHADELVQYLRGIRPKTLVLNGDIVDIWQFSKRYFPQSHMQVIKEIFSLLSLGTRVVYITGNHDEIMRRYSDLVIGQLELTDKLILELDGKVTWIFHGDVFDRTTRGSAKIIAKLGGYGYDLLILLNRAINYLMTLMGREKMSLSKQVKNGVKKAVAWINNFEQTAAELAIENQYDFVVCGHIHQPQYREIKTDKGSVTYLNSGDWIENLTSLEYENGQWSIYHHDQNAMPAIEKKTKIVPLSKVLSIENLVSQQIAFTGSAKK